MNEFVTVIIYHPESNKRFLRTLRPFDCWSDTVIELCKPLEKFCKPVTEDITSLGFELRFQIPGQPTVAKVNEEDLNTRGAIYTFLKYCSDNLICINVVTKLTN